MGEKYELVGEPSPLNGLYRIRALKDFGRVRAGEIGGQIQFEFNLSQEGNAWITAHAMAYHSAVVRDDAWVGGHVDVFGDAIIGGHAVLDGSERISTGALIVPAEGFAVAKDRRDYTFLAAWRDGEIVSVTAGCRAWISLAEARKHYGQSYCSDGDRHECLMILDHLERIARHRMAEQNAEPPSSPA